MKKKILICTLLSGLIFSFLSCGSSWERTKKDFTSDFGGGLPRQVLVYCFPKTEPVFEYSGKCYITDDSTVGDVALICYDDKGNSKKVDFIGEHLSIIVKEL